MGLKINAQEEVYLSDKAKTLIKYFMSAYGMDKDLALEVTKLKLPEEQMYDLPEPTEG